MEKGEGGASNYIRTAMDGMEVGEEEMDKRESEEAEEENTEAEGGGFRGGAVGTVRYRAPDSGCGSRRHNPC